MQIVGFLMRRLNYGKRNQLKIKFDQRFIYKIHSYVCRVTTGKESVDIFIRRFNAMSLSLSTSYMKDTICTKIY